MSITPECYSGILVKNTPSFRKGLGVGYICRFLRFTFSFTPLIPCLLPPRDEREKTERTTAQLPALQKCYFLIFAIAIGCLLLAAIPASFPPFSFLSAVMLCGVPDNAFGVLGCTLRFRPREFPRLYTLHFTPSTIKNRPSSHFYLVMSKKCCIFAPYIKLPLLNRKAYNMSSSFKLIQPTN